MGELYTLEEYDFKQTILNDFWYGGGSKGRLGRFGLGEGST